MLSFLQIRLRDLLQLFEVRERNAWTSSCQQMDEICDSRFTNMLSRIEELAHKTTVALSHHFSPSHRNVAVQSNATAAYPHKHSDLDATTCNDLNQNDRQHSGCNFPQSQAINGAKTKLNRLPNICLSELAATLPSSSHTTRSEPATRSNSIECEKDVPKLTVVNKVNRDTDSSRSRLDLIVPNG